ncbi:MAG: transposase [Pleurocapsa sp. MO_226.B13]|nr:transposase [Pleurocapsa sp. MO_226.B13]
MNQNRSSEDKLERIDRITAAIGTLEQQKEIIKATGEVASDGCVVSRYQVRQQKKIYWYYKLQAPKPTFPKANDTKTLSKYKHLGKAGSEAHITAVMQVVRRAQIDEIQRNIDTLTQALLDVGYDDQPKKK